MIMSEILEEILKALSESEADDDGEVNCLIELDGRGKWYMRAKRDGSVIDFHKMP